ncbi:MAG: hypothetical protein JW959_02260 [Pirellulales bacterium]|nr:hypothetical protein [Pirellulales bacterium]
MIGVIRARDVLFHPFTTIRCFGWRTFFRALKADSDITFLSLLGDAHLFESAESESAAIMRRCIALELRAKRIYENLTRLFSRSPAEARFFAVLAQQEQEHADLLDICLAASRRLGWRHGCFNPWRDYLPGLEQDMREAEYAASAVDDLNDALRLVVRIESSEINLVFRGALNAGRSAFTRCLRPFREAIETHINFIVTEISRLAPDLTIDPRELRARFSCSA